MKGEGSDPKGVPRAEAALDADIMVCRFQRLLRAFDEENVWLGNDGHYVSRYISPGAELSMHWGMLQVTKYRG